MKLSLNKILQKKLLASKKLIKCDLCLSESFYPFWNCNDFFYVKCSCCGLVFQNPQPEIEEIKKFYDKDYFQYEVQNHRAFFNLMKLSLNDIAFDQITRKLKQASFLDVGCATGMLLNYIKQKGWQTYGVEICEESAKYAKENFDLKIYNKSLEECHFPNNFFDVIHFSHVIEHLINPSKFLTEVYRILKSNGYIIITTPNVDGIFSRIFKNKWRSSISQHLFLFSSKTLKTIVEKTGFHVIKQLSWGSLPVEISNGNIKKILDFCIKKINMGDVTLLLAIK